MENRKQNSLTVAATIIGLFATIVSVLVSLFQCNRELVQQKHEIRIKYLDLALAEKSDAYEKGRVLRFLKLIDDDKTIQEWAKTELDTVEKYKTAEKSGEIKAKELAAIEDSIKKISKDTTRYASEIKHLEGKKHIIRSDLDSISSILERTSKEASIVDDHKFHFSKDLSFSDIAAGPNCNEKTISSFSGENKENEVCVDSYSSQQIKSAVYNDKNWEWMPSKSTGWDKEWDKQWDSEEYSKIKCRCEAMQTASKKKNRRVRAKF